MRIVITTIDTALAFMRRAGYGYQKEGSGEIAFVRRVSGSLFPRYHAYVTEREGQVSARPDRSVGGVRPDASVGIPTRSRRECQVLEINLHVDQKAPTYQRGRAHAGEYDGPLVEQEAARLRELAQANGAQRGDPEKPAPGGSASGGIGFWGKLFG